MSNVDINVDRRTDGQTENRTPISHPATSRCDNKMSQRMTKPTKWHVLPAKMSLGIQPILSEFSLCTQWVAKDPSFHVDTEDCHFVGFFHELAQIC